MNEEISAELRAKLDELARVQDVRPGDLRDEHERWALYVVAIERGVGAARLFDLLPLEPDLAMAFSAVVKMVERSAPEERRAWLTRIPEDAREYARGRVAELETVDALRSGDFPADRVAGSLDGWSNWLQLRVTEYVEDAAVLEIMATRGSTKRVRRQAAEGLRALRR